MELRHMETYNMQVLSVNLSKPVEIIYRG